MRLHAYASWPHYIDHIAPIWHMLHEDVKGDFGVSSPHLLSRLKTKGIEGVLVARKTGANCSPTGNGPILVAGYSDLKKQKSRPTAFLEHGAGQTYVMEDGSTHGGYSGGKNRGNVNLFVCPNETVAKANISNYPLADAVAVGCPRLDDLLEMKGGFNDNKSLTIAASFHWDCQVTKESGTAFKYFSDQILDFAKWCKICGIDFIGHSHPKSWKTLKGWWEHNKIEAVQEWEEVVKRSDVLVIDNSSIMFEAAALGMGVIVLESPEWRKQINHGLRFWDLADVGPTVRPNESLVSALSAAVSPKWAKKGKEIAAQVYAIPPSKDKISSATAAFALENWVERLAKGKNGKNC